MGTNAALAAKFCPNSVKVGIMQRSQPGPRALFEPVGVKGFLPLAVVKRIVGVEPIALGVHGEIRDLGEFRRLDQELLLRDEAGDQLNFRFVQVKLPAVEVPVHVGIREKNLRGTALNDYVEDVRALEFVERLR